MRFDIIDRRVNPKGKSLPNRRRFMERQRKNIKEAIKRHIRDGNITDSADGTDKVINISSKEMSEPTFHHCKSGKNEQVFPGNKEYIAGDKIPRPQGEGGMGGTEGSPDGEAQDEFIFAVAQSEYDQLLFEDMELPPMIKRMLIGSDEFKLQRAGFMSEGPASKLDIVQSIRRARPRRAAIRAAKKRKILQLEKEREALITHLQNIQEKTAED